MSQAGLLRVRQSNLPPQVPTSFVTNSGTAVPVANVLNVLGSVVAADSNPFRSIGSGNTVNYQVQISQAIVATDATKIGLAAFDSSAFAVDANGFVTLIGGGAGILRVNVQTGTSPIVPSGGAITLNGAVVSAGTNPVRTDGTGANTAAVEVQISQAIAASDATKIGLSNFNSAQFSVDANGFVSATGTIPIQFTANSGNATPAAGNVNILGLSGSKTSASGSTVTVKSPPFSQVGVSGTSVLNTGEFVTAAITRTLPVSAGLADGDLFIYVCTTAGALVIQAVGAQKIRIGNVISSAAGTATSTAIGDSITLRFNATDGFFYEVSIQGTWNLA